MQRVRDDAQHKIRNTQHATRNTRRNTRHNTRHILRIACFVLSLAACQVPGAVRPTVKVGLVAPFEGRYRYVGYDVIYAVRLALREANAAGGVEGYSVELVAYDDGADPAMAVQQARKLAVDPDVIAAIGHFREETTAVALSVYAEAGVPLVAPGVLDPALTRGDAQGPGVYRLGPVADALAHALLDRLDQLGHRQAALVTEGGPLGAALRRNAQPARLRLWPVVSPQGTEPQGTEPQGTEPQGTEPQGTEPQGTEPQGTEPQGTDWLGQVRASGAQAVFCDAGPVAAGEVVTALREAGWQGTFLGGPQLAAADFVAVAGHAAQGAVFVTPWPFPADAAAAADFAAAYQRVSNGLPPGPLAAPAYEATWVLLEALQRDIAAHGVPTREGIAAALPSTSREGLLGLIAFDADRSWGDAPLYSYRIGAEGLPVLINGHSATRR
jgi:ABC-type branched-subunit amino acid transport system substrate-binding protein